MAKSDRPNFIPVPDPTVLTTEQLRRELQSQREYILSELSKVSAVNDEKFVGVDLRFGESKTALDAALRAQKDIADVQTKANAEAAEKTERAFTKQFDAMMALVASTSKATDDRIMDLTRRLDRGEGMATGGAAVKTEHRLDVGTLVAIISVIVAALAVVAAVVVVLKH